MIIAAIGEVPLDVISIILLAGTILVNISLSRQGFRTLWISQLVMVISIVFFSLEKQFLLSLFSFLILSLVYFKSRKKTKYLNGFSTLAILLIILGYGIMVSGNIFLSWALWALLCFCFSLMMGNKHVFDLLLLNNLFLLLLVFSASMISGSLSTNIVLSHDYELLQGVALLLLLITSLFSLFSGILMAFLTKRTINYYFMETILDRLDKSDIKLLDSLNHFFNVFRKNFIKFFSSLSKLSDFNQVFEHFHASMITMFLSLSDLSRFFEESINDSTHYFSTTVFGMGETAVSLQKNTINRDVLFIMMGLLIVLLGGLLL